jgi:hypothetical protein
MSDAKHVKAPEAITQPLPRGVADAIKEAEWLRGHVAAGKTLRIWQKHIVDLDDYAHTLQSSLERTERELREARAKLATAEVRAEWWAPVYTKHRLPGPTDGPFVVTWGPNGGAGIQDWSHVSPLLHTKWAHLNPPCICADPENCKERVRGCKRDLAALSNPSNPQQPAAKSQAEQMRDPVYVLNFIANAKRFDRFHFDDDTAFADWAQSLARHVIGDPSNPEKGES